MVEKMGHKKMLQTARMDWINEGKSGAADQDDALYDDPTLPIRENGEREKTASRIAPIFEKTAATNTKTPDIDEEMDMNDLYGATPKRTNAPAGGVTSQNSIFGGGASIFGPKTTAHFDEGMDDDELDALLAEEDALQAGKKQAVVTAPKAKPVQNGFGEGMDEDELDALLAEEDALQAASGNKKPPVAASKAKPPVQDDFDDEMEAMAEMDGMW